MLDDRTAQHLKATHAIHDHIVELELVAECRQTLDEVVESAIGQEETIDALRFALRVERGIHNLWLLREKQREKQTAEL